MPAIAIEVFNGRANHDEFVLQDIDGNLMDDLSDITRVIVSIGSEVVDSNSSPNAIWWTDSETRTIYVNGVNTTYTGDVLKLKLGSEGLTAGTNTGCCITIYDAGERSLGEVITNKATIVVRDTCPQS